MVGTTCMKYWNEMKSFKKKLFKNDRSMKYFYKGRTDFYLLLRKSCRAVVQYPGNEDRKRIQ